MKTFDYTITDTLGIHARPAGELVALAKTFASRITIAGNGKSADCKRMLAVMSLGIKQGHTVSVTAEGGDEDNAAAALKDFLMRSL
ncbi:MAG TPA: HPr family phosphocarrier protein [Treponema sp.]|nr:HPr family phosphocarrier protein [Treponema sp.]